MKTCAASKQWWTWWIVIALPGVWYVLHYVLRAL